MPKGRPRDKYPDDYSSVPRPESNPDDKPPSGSDSQENLPPGAASPRRVKPSFIVKVPFDDDGRIVIEEFKPSKYQIEKMRAILGNAEIRQMLSVEPPEAQMELTGEQLLPIVKTYSMVERMALRMALGYTPEEALKAPATPLEDKALADALADLLNRRSPAWLRKNSDIANLVGCLIYHGMVTHKAFGIGRAAVALAKKMESDKRAEQNPIPITVKIPESQPEASQSESESEVAPVHYSDQVADNGESVEA